MDFKLVMANIQIAHPDYNLKSHSPFGGFASMSGPIYNINTMILGFVAFTLPILVTCLRRIIVKKLDSLAHSFSERTLKGSKLLTKVLTHLHSLHFQKLFQLNLHNLGSKLPNSVHTLSLYIMLFPVPIYTCKFISI